MVSGLAASLKDRRRVAAVAMVLAVCGGILWLRSDPKAVLLFPKRGALWIGAPEPLFLDRRLWTDKIVYFRKRFTLQVLTDVELEATALRACEARLDGKVVLSSRAPESWKKPSRLRLPRLAVGAHDLFFTVLNRGGPAMLRADLRGSGVATGPDWEASPDAVHWAPALPAGNRRRPQIAARFPSAGEALFKLLPALLSVFVLAFLWAWGQENGKGPAWLPRAPTPGQWRWILLGAWGFLALNNLWKVPLNVGFDVGAHMDYVAYVARHRRVPLASEGWQMFQPPLYYLLSAPFYSLVSRLFTEETTARLLRLIPLLCGAAQVEVGYRAMRIVYPRRRDLQALGTVLAGLFPMNLYLSQAVSNEGLCGVLSAAAIIMVWKLAPAASWKGVWAAGTVLGFAILSKVTAVLLILPLAFFLAWTLARRRSARQAAAWLALFLAAASTIAGWYYLRNWMALGHPFFTSSRGLWWQDPGFRAGHQLWCWGESLRHPVYASHAGFWDGLYSTLWGDGYLSSMIRFESRPPWDYGYMLSGAWLALLPSAGILIGVLAALFGEGGPQRPYQRFAAACLGLYLGAMLVLYVTLPIYSVVKATYTMGILPCYAVLACAGFAVLMKGPVSRAAVKAGMACWAMAAYLSYLAR